jgi:hypothetical protein
MMMLKFIMIMIIEVMRRRRINNYCNSRAGSVTCYSLQPLHKTLKTNNLNSSENPRTFTKADERFFYFKAWGSNVAFETMHNGSEYMNSIKICFCLQ